MMKARTVVGLILLVVIADQLLKIYVKTHFHINESYVMIPDWARLHFVENEGMAYGWKFGGDAGKLLLTLFRLLAVLFGVWYLNSIIKKKYHPGYIVCASLIFAGALGNLIDSMFYGMLFEESIPGSMQVARMFPEKGYAGFLHGKVVDMFYFPMITGHFPSWVPLWGGEDFEFFRPIFNLADASISTGVFILIFFQKRFFAAHQNSGTGPTVETSALVNDDVQVQ